MIKKIVLGVAAASLVTFAAPAIAQDTPEEARTTYELRFLDLAPGAEGRYLELVEKYYFPARAAAGLEPVNIHFLMTGEYDILLPMVMPRGMSMFDAHSNPEGAAFNTAFVELAGGEEEAQKIRDEMSTLVRRVRSVYSHTHP